MHRRSLALIVLLLLGVAGAAAWFALRADETVPAAAPVPETAPRPTPPPTVAAPAGDGAELADGLAGGCLTGGDDAPSGTAMVVDAPATAPADITYLVEVEEGLAVDAECFAQMVEEILEDPRSWAGDESTIARVDSGPVDFRVALLSPAMTDAECAPLDTNGIYSCWSGTRAVINVWRWEHGTADYADDLAEYRRYVVNHEVGHALGHGHVGCPGPGEVAPVMHQQTKGLDGCVANGWPLPSER